MSAKSMIRQKVFMSFLFVITGFFMIGISGFFLVSTWEEQTDRTPASELPLIAPPISAFSAQEQVKQLGIEPSKMRAPIQARLSSSAIPDDADQNVRLMATIYINRESSDKLEVTWSLPDGCKLVEGNLAEVFDVTGLGEKKQVSIVVRGFSKQKSQLISVGAFFISTQSESRIGASAVISSLPESHTESLAPAMLAAAKQAELEIQKAKDDNSEHVDDKGVDKK